jgi:transcriptional regulator with XRE-family HTH domain
MKDEHKITFGRRVRRIRTVLGLTIEELALRAGLSPLQVTLVEQGECALTPVVVLSLIRGLGCAPRVLLRAPCKRVSDEEEEGRADRLFQPVSPEVQAAVLQILRAIGRKGGGPVLSPRRD